MFYVQSNRAIALTNYVSERLAACYAKGLNPDVADVQDFREEWIKNNVLCLHCHKHVEGMNIEEVFCSADHAADHEYDFQEALSTHN